jgi:hypothetical protein
MTPGAEDLVEGELLEVGPAHAGARVVVRERRGEAGSQADEGAHDVDGGDDAGEAGLAVDDEEVVQARFAHEARGQGDGRARVHD